MVKVFESFGDYMGSINELNSSNKKFIKGMFKLKVKKTKLEQYLPGHLNIYYDADTSSWYMVSDDIGSLKINNEDLLSEIKNYLTENKIYIEGIPVEINVWQLDMSGVDKLLKKHKDFLSVKTTSQETRLEEVNILIHQFATEVNSGKYKTPHNVVTAIDNTIEMTEDMENGDWQFKKWEDKVKFLEIVKEAWEFLFINKKK